LLHFLNFSPATSLRPHPAHAWTGFQFALASSTCGLLWDVQYTVL
jgi:hypothetical protein